MNQIPLVHSAQSLYGNRGVMVCAHCCHPNVHVNTADPVQLLPAMSQRTAEGAKTQVVSRIEEPL